jgi:phage-related tail fiber protein
MTILDRVGNVPEELAWKAPCAAGSTGAPIALNGLYALDGVTLVENMRVLVKDQADETQNGIYQASTGNWTRPHDASGNESFIGGTQVLVARGTVNAFQTFVVSSTDDPIVVGTSNLTFAGLKSVAAIVNANLAQMAAGTVKSNITGVAATPGDNLLTSILDLFSTAWGALVYRGSAAWQALGPGTNGQVLTSQGPNATPVWGPGGYSGSYTDGWVEHGHFGGI